MLAVKLCNDTITLFHACVDPETGGNAWIPTTVSGASWYMTDTSTVDTGKGGLVAANKVTVRIPAEAAPDGLALSNGDIIVRGDLSKIFDVGQVVFAESENRPDNSEGLVGATVGDASGVENPTPAKLKKLYGADCATVLGITDNRRAPHAPHWRIAGT